MLVYVLPMRLFIAIDAPSFSHISLQNKSFRNTSHFHITLAFFGDVDLTQMIAIKSKFDHIVAESFTLQTKCEFGAFANWNKLRTVYVPIEQNKYLTQLVLKIWNLFSEFNLGKEFTPHITIARVKNEIQDKAIIKNLQSQKFEFQKWKVSEIVLYESILTPNGSEYRILKKKQLK